MLEPGEACDGDDFDGKTCESYGLGAGTLVCNVACSVVLTGCTPHETCTNQLDDDGDGLVDCDDADCGTALACTDACASPIFVAVPSTTQGDNTGFPDVLHSTCMPSAGREVIYQFVAPSTETLLVRVQFPAFDAGLAIRTACDDEATEVVCANATVPGEEKALFQADAGQTYYAIVESISDATGFFQLDVEEVMPESSCDDFVDDDFDGRVDCDDETSCQASALCAPGAGPVGSACLDNPDCAANHADPVCLQAFIGYANGYCSEFCDLAADDCPSGSICAQIGISADGVCLASCQSPSDCRPGYACLDEGFATSVCDKEPELVCDDGADNDADGLVDCEDASGCASSPSCIPGPGAVGSPCQLHNQCGANAGGPYCIDQFHHSWPGGYCSEFCDLAADDCPSGNACSSWIAFASGHGLCFRTCAGTPDCPLGYSCQSDGSHMICVH
jgi:hypothetical protein